MEIKVAEYSDYERIAQLHADSWRRYYQGILSDDYLADEVLTERSTIWQTRLINPPFNQHVLLAEEGGLLCGFICAFGNHDFERGTIIDSIHIDSAYRGKGLGKRLMAEMAQWVDQYFSDNGMYLEVLKQNQQAVDFYSHIGGEQTLERTWNSPCGSQLTEQIYTWKSAKELLNKLGYRQTAAV
ncbi:N-acetyltransferase family protein [Vibrio sp.]|uniref:GNAT family N-acetyltransferase n=1 Tax=Vibrio sp. TaxID=678 RepID=UPI003D0EF363